MFRKLFSDKYLYILVTCIFRTNTGLSEINEKMYYASFILWRNFKLGARKQLLKQLNITQWNQMEFNVMQFDLLVMSLKIVLFVSDSYILLNQSYLFIFHDLSFNFFA